MTDDADITLQEQLPTAQELCLAYLGPEERNLLGPAFALDQRIARIVAGSNEHILAQMRIAWWREMLGKPVEKRPNGDLVLGALSTHWIGREGALVQLLDAWEEILLCEAFDDTVIDRVAKGRGAFVLEALNAFWPDFDDAKEEFLAQRWVIADLAAHCKSLKERERVLNIASNYPPIKPALPRGLRGIIVLDALARHSIKNGGQPLGDGRWSALIALRVGLLGR